MEFEGLVQADKAYFFSPFQVCLGFLKFLLCVFSRAGHARWVGINFAGYFVVAHPLLIKLENSVLSFRYAYYSPYFRDVCINTLLACLS